jgi:hypothetical protein
LRLRILFLFVALAAESSALVVGYNPIGTSTFGDPNGSSYVVSFNQVADNVNLNSEVLIESSVGTCTGSLLSDGMSILTAAHCLDPSATASGVFNGTVSIAFDQDCGAGFYCGGYDVTGAANFLIDPGYLADNGAMCISPGVPGGTLACAAFQGDDLAVIRLNSPAPASAVGYSLYTGDPNDAIGPILELLGAGYTGQGCIGGTLNTSNNTCPQNSDYQPEAAAVMRQGQNQYIGTCAGCTNILMGQFQSNSSVADQVNVAPGDSGGGTFYNGLLVGVHDFTSCSSPVCPITGVSGFGDTFVGGSNAVWIESVEVNNVPEPAPAPLVAMGIAVALLIEQRRRAATR